MIKVDIEESKKDGSEFPKLMRDKLDNSIVFVLSGSSPALVISGPQGGFYYDYTYPMYRLEDFHGEITLRNE